LRETITKLAEEHAQAQAFLSSMADGLLVTDAFGNIILMNKPAEEICDLQYQFAVGQPLNTVIENYEINELLRNTLATKNNSQGEIIIKYPTLRHIQVHIAPVEVEGNTFGAVITLYDITQIRKIESTQRDFVANVSHELRTPVTSIRAMLETLLDGGKDDPEMTEDFLRTLVGESERLTKLLDDLLNLARIESGHKRLNITKVDMVTILNETINRIHIAIKAKKQKIITNLPGKLEINADSDVMMQIFLNLLDNARKYSPEKATITISAEMTADNVIIKIMDTGYGIPAEDLDRIFERFYRVDKARARAEGGTGLGLAIVKNLVEMHNGEISAHNVEGQGTEFIIRLLVSPILK
jgi:two-component system phosphate regulon sensor histidine kinase PhoR